MDLETTTRRIDTFDALPAVPGDEDFAGGFTFDQDLTEIWAGVTWARKVGTRIGLGVSPYIAYRGQKLRRQTIIEVLQATGDLASLTDIRIFEYQNYRALAKVGVGFDLRPLTFGIAATTPSANVLGTGSSGVHSFLGGVDVDGDGARGQGKKSAPAQEQPCRHQRL